MHERLGAPDGEHEVGCHRAGASELRDQAGSEGRRLPVRVHLPPAAAARVAGVHGAEDAGPGPRCHHLGADIDPGDPQRAAAAGAPVGGVQHGQGQVGEPEGWARPVPDGPERHADGREHALSAIGPGPADPVGLGRRLAVRPCRRLWCVDGLLEPQPRLRDVNGHPLPGAHRPSEARGKRRGDRP